MFGNMKIGLRLGVGFGSVLLLMLTIIWIGVSRLDSVNGVVHLIVTELWQKTVMPNDIIGFANENARNNYALVLTTDKDKQQQILERIENNRSKINRLLDQMAPMVHSSEGKRLFEAIQEKRKPYLASFAKVAKLVALGDRENAARMMETETVLHLNEYVAAIDSLIEHQSKHLEEGGQEAREKYISGRDLMLGLGAAAVFIGLLFAIFVTRSITQPVGEAVKALNRMAEGDLTVGIEAKSTDEVGQMMKSMKTMVERLSQTMAEVRAASDNISSASEEVSATAQSMSQAANEQAASVEETNSAIEEMAASITQNAENAKVTDGIAAKAAKEATEGGEAVTKTVAAMKQIAGKIVIIDDIAYQTNLLALNAAIEAARAGEHGKGFAVVAAEVRKLAERSQVAAQEIGELAGGSVETAERAGILLTEMVPSIKKTSDLVQEITASSEEQSSGVSQINTAVGQLSQATQQNASSAEELAATAEEMSGQAEALQNLLSFFKTETHASAAVARAPAKRREVTASLPSAHPPMTGPGAHTLSVKGNGQDHPSNSFVKF